MGEAFHGLPLDNLLQHSRYGVEVVFLMFCPCMDDTIEMDAVMSLGNTYTKSDDVPWALFLENTVAKGEG